MRNSLVLGASIWDNDIGAALLEVNRMLCIYDFDFAIDISSSEVETRCTAKPDSDRGKFEEWRNFTCQDSGSPFFSGPLNSHCVLDLIRQSQTIRVMRASFWKCNKYALQSEHP